MAPTTDDFSRALRALLAEAKIAGKAELEVRAGDLHRRVADPLQSNRMPSCCSAMRAAMGSGDRVLYSPPKGNGSRFTVVYRL
jgi:5-methylcytosine-specific restriction protein A